MPTAAEIAADLTEVRAARLALVKGERIKEVWREGRRLTFGEVTLKSLNDLILVLENDYAAAVAEESGGLRRRAIGLSWTN